MHFYQSAFGTRLLCLCLSNCLAKVGSTIVFCKRIVSTTRQRFAVAYMSCSLDSATLLDQKTTVGNAGAGKNVCICMHAHTNCKLFWQASYQSLLGGVIVNEFLDSQWMSGFTMIFLGADKGFRISTVGSLDSDIIAYELSPINSLVLLCGRCLVCHFLLCPAS